MTILVRKRQTKLTWEFTFYILPFVLVCVLLRFSFELFSDKVFFLDWLFNDLTFSCQFYLLFCSGGYCLVLFVCFPGGPSSPTRRFTPENGHFMDDILWFLRASGFDVLFLLCCYALVHAIVLWQVLVFSCALVVHQLYFCGLLILF